MHLVQALIILDDVVCDRQASLARGLGGQNFPCLLNRFGVASQQTLKLRLLIAINDENSIDELSER